MASRFASVDALRGVVMFTMLFVNDLPSSVPKWMQHAPVKANGMTFVDWVFGAFLFIVGMSIPLAFAGRLGRGEPWWRLVLHVLVRTAGLLLLGLFMVNGERGVAPNGWPKHLWEMLVFLFGILAFLAPPGRSPQARQVGLALRIIGLAGFVVLAFVFRDAKGAWMRTSWWGILGLIGWAYLVASIAYLLLRGRREWMVAAVALLAAMFLAEDHGMFRGVWGAGYVDFGVLGSHAAATMAGVVLGSVVLDAAMSVLERVRWAILFGLLLLCAGALMYPLYGIHKNGASPSWSLICAAATCWLWALLALPVDAVGLRWPFALFIHGGQNVLLAYLLKPLFVYFTLLTGLKFYEKFGDTSDHAIVRALVAAAIVLGLAGFLNGRGVRLRL